MRFLADESCDHAVVLALRGAGHDVVGVGESARGATDDAVIELASRERRVVLTEDKDFGQLVFASAKSSAGVLFIRFPAQARSNLAAEIVDLAAERGEELLACFVTVQPGRVRVTRLPPGQT
jgi:predicted nuclease of predicted toxin-antitoxin system